MNLWYYTTYLLTSNSSIDLCENMLDETQNDLSDMEFEESWSSSQVESKSTSTINNQEITEGNKHCTHKPFYKYKKKYRLHKYKKYQEKQKKKQRNFKKRMEHYKNHYRNQPSLFFNENLHYHIAFSNHIKDFKIPLFSKSSKCKDLKLIPLNESSESSVHARRRKKSLPLQFSSEFDM